MDEIKVLTRRLQREKSARLEAEAILENKSLELHESKVAVESTAKELQSQNVRIRAIVDSAAEGIVTLDFDFKVLSFNPAAERIFGSNESAVVGTEFSKLIDGLDSSYLRTFLESDERILEPTEYSTLLDDNRNVVVELNISKTVGDEASSMIVIVRDRTKSKQLEAQLAIAQKMESIGQLSAGIAHEINSPMQYVSDNTRFLKEAFADIESLLKKYEAMVECVKSGGDANQIIGSIENEFEDADLEFTLEEIPQAIEQTIHGADRITKIVQAMKVFSHPGETESRAFDLNQAIRSTVDVSKNEWKYVADIQLELEEDLPFCNGYPSKLNQALLNLVVNGAHAIGKRIENEKNHKGIIRIASRLRDQWAEIEIEDNGCGISKEDIHRIFDPFFTTKPVGKGTGQGLSIAHSVVVDTHGGKIDLISTVGQGTTFLIHLPIQKPNQPEPSNTQSFKA